MSQQKRTKLSKDLLVKALVWNCPHYSREGAFSCCIHFDGTRSNCVHATCSQVFDIFRTMAKIDNGEIEVF